MRIRQRWIPVAVALALSLGLALAAPNVTVAQTDPDVVTEVGDTAITVDDFHARVRFVRWQYLQEIAKLHELTAGNLGLTAGRALTLLEGLRESSALGAQVLAQMEDEVLAQEAAANLRIAPSDEEIAARRDAFFSLWTGVEVEDLADDAAAQAFIDEWYAAAQAASSLERDAIDEVFAMEALWDALYDAVAAQAPTEELHVHSRHILCDFEADPGAAPTDTQRTIAQDCIRAAQERLAGGEAFEDVATDASADKASAERGGDLGWIPLSYLVDGYAAAAEIAPLNAVIGPVETEQGLHLLEVLEREVRPLTDQDRAEAQAALFGQWMEALRAEATITRGERWQSGIPADPGLDTLAPDVLAALDRLEGAR